MASNRHATSYINHGVFICIAVSLLLPIAHEGAAKTAEAEGKLTREYHLRQGALKGLIVKPSRQYDLQQVEMFLGIPYAAPPVGSLRFMPPVNAPPWRGTKTATRFAPVCPQTLPSIKKNNPPSLGRQHYLNRLRPFLTHESEDCLYLNIYIPYREQKSKKFPVLVFIHGDSFEWSSGNPYDGRILASYGNIMVVTLNFRLGILGFMKPSLTEHVYGNNGLLDQLAALQWIKDNIEDLNGDPQSVTLMGHGTGAACVSYLMLSPISNGLFHRAILMSGSALSDWAMTRDPTQYTLQVAQSLGCNPTSKDLMACLQSKPVSEIKKVQILARDFETPLGPAVAGSFIPNEPATVMESFPNLLSKYQLLSGVTELERYHDFGVIELDHGILENQRDEFITKYTKVVFEGAEDKAFREILKYYAPTKLDPQRWNVETNRDVILNLFSDARTLSPTVSFTNYQSKSNRQSYFYVFGHNSVSTDFAPLNKSVHGQEIPYVLGVPLGGAHTHFHSEYTQKEKLLSEVIMRLWTNFVKIGTPNTQSVNAYYTLDQKQWSQYNVEWPEYNVAHQSYLRLDIPPYVSSLYRENYTKFWIETLPNKMRKFIVDPLFDYTPTSTTHKPKSPHRGTDAIRKIFAPPARESSRVSAPSFGRLLPYSPVQRRPDTDFIYKEIQAIKTPSRPAPPELMEKTNLYTTTIKPKTSTPVAMIVKTSSATMTLIISLCILFLIVNIGICSILYFKKRRIQIRERTFECTRPSRAEIGEVDTIGQKSAKDDKSALQALKNSCSVIKSIKLNKIKKNSKKSRSSKLEPCKTPKSDDSGGFRERFQLRRHLSTSTLDAHTKVRDWITNEVMHRCTPSILRKSNTDLSTDKQYSVAKPYTRSEELLSEPKKVNKVDVKINEPLKSKKDKNNYNNRTKTSEKTTSTSALGSHSSIDSNKYSTNSMKRSAKSSDSLKSKGNESIKSKKVSVAIDATPAARTNSILKQEPIELSKSVDNSIENIVTENENKLRRSKTQSEVIEIVPNSKDKNAIFTNEITLCLNKDKSLKISHKHSTSDPVTDSNYDKFLKAKIECGVQVTDILPPLSFRNEVNVTSKDESIQVQPLSAAEALLTIQRRNFPKVLPDLPKSQKRLSLQPGTLQSFRSFSNNVDIQLDRLKVPPLPPPRTTTLDRRLAYKNSKPSLSSFEVPTIAENSRKNQNYENIELFSSPIELNTSFNKSYDEIDNSRQETRDFPKVIIASNDIPNAHDPKYMIKLSPSQVEIPSNVPRVRLPDDFHSLTTGSVTSFSSFCSDDDIDEIEGDFDEDKLIQELVGGVESPTNMEDVLDSKGPDTIFEKNLEIVPVKINVGNSTPKSRDNYVCVTDLFLPDVSNLNKTAQIKPNFGLNKLQQRSESIHKPLERAIKVKHKKSIKPVNLLSKSIKTGRKDSDKSKCDSTKLEHSNSGSSNDTETSTGTVKKVEIKK